MIWFAIGLLFANAIVDWILFMKVVSILDSHNRMFEQTLEILKDMK